MTVLSPLLALVAGGLSILSPCVLPLLPILFGTAASQHRFGPMAMAAGMAVSFTALGLFLATAGLALGLDTDGVRRATGVVMLLVGVTLAVPVIGRRVAAAGAPLSAWGQARLSGYESSGLAGQALLGALLGLVWSPCVGPTLGAASLLASQGEDLGQAAAVMLAFGVGAAGALAGVGYATRRSLSPWRSRLRLAGESGRRGLGIVLMALATLIILGFDRTLEAFVVEHAPTWLTDLTTRF